LPWNHRGWHAGGDANNTHIGFEICEDGLTDASYFSAVYKEAVELCVYLCKLYDLVIRISSVIVKAISKV
jgi:N-acetylmuramoyl-L-alanine amidase